MSTPIDQVVADGTPDSINARASMKPEISSGMGIQSVLPAELKKWNWGAFFLSVIWGIGNKTWIALLALIPYLGFIMMIVLGFKGSEWAWKNKRWDSVEHFQRVQKRWAIWGGILFAIAIIGHLAAAYEDYIHGVARSMFD